MSKEDTSSEKKNNASDNIEKEVKYLLKKNIENRKSNYELIKELKEKYNDNEIVELIMNKYKHKRKHVNKLSIKIRDKLLTKYPNLELKEYIEKVALYKKKYNFDDSEMYAIVHLLFNNKSYIKNESLVDTTNNEMSKALGFIPQSYNFGKMSVSQTETEELQAILTIASATRELHNQITLQSIVYQDLLPQALQGKFDKTKINLFSFVHPVVAALFIPKFKYLDDHMLLASIANIVAARRHGLDIKTQQEYELYIDIATDPSEMACVVKKQPFRDLLNRCTVQTKLWESVLSLRQGKYYINDLSSFILAIDSCKNNVFDAADLAYVKDEGTVLRKLFGAFSIRPTIVSTAPIYGISTLTGSMPPINASHITTLSMITMRIPIYDTNISHIKLNDSLDQRQAYIQNKQITIKSQQLLYSREILVFYVHRRFQTLSLSKLTRPYNMTALPVTLSEYERLQGTIVQYDFRLRFPYQEFVIKSIVSVDTVPVANDTGNNTNTNIIVGCSAIIIDDQNPNIALYYKPLDIENQNPSYTNPLHWLPYDDGTDECVISIAQKRGTLFIYKVDPSSVINNNNSPFQP